MLHNGAPYSEPQKLRPGRIRYRRSKILHALSSSAMRAFEDCSPSTACARTCKDTSDRANSDLAPSPQPEPTRARVLAASEFSESLPPAGLVSRRALRQHEASHRACLALHGPSSSLLEAVPLFALTSDVSNTPKRAPPPSNPWATPLPTTTSCPRTLAAVGGLSSVAPLLRSTFGGGTGTTANTVSSPVRALESATQLRPPPTALSASSRSQAHAASGARPRTHGPSADSATTKRSASNLPRAS